MSVAEQHSVALITGKQQSAHLTCVSWVSNTQVNLSNAGTKSKLKRLFTVADKCQSNAINQSHDKKLIGPACKLLYNYIRAMEVIQIQHSTASATHKGSKKPNPGPTF